MGLILQKRYISVKIILINIYYTVNYKINYKIEVIFVSSIQSPYL